MKFNFLSMLKPLLIVLVLACILGACASGEQPPGTPVALPPGDATHGAELFTQSVNGAPPCSTCHQLDDSTVVGPGMKGYGSRAGGRVSGEDAEQYTQESITHPASFVVSGFANAMYNQYGSKLSPQDIADLTAYLLTL
jgi:cytochrome c553